MRLRTHLLIFLFAKAAHGHHAFKSEQTPADAQATRIVKSETRCASHKGLRTSPLVANYKLVESHSGSNFFDNFTFWNTSDPTRGAVNYRSRSDAEAMNLTGINDVGNAFIKVETTPVVSGNRSSIRIGTDNTFTEGIFVIDALHMPYGCGIWPAFWSTGPNWPTYGEIDIIEGVNEYTQNQASIHTAPGCSLPSNSSEVLGMEATLVGPTDCDARKTNDQGCGMRSNSNGTFGSGFNSVGGGVYALVWSDKEIVVHFFPRNSIPQDLLSDSPTPDTWGTPMTRWPSTDCDINKFFQNHTIIINTTLCGTWAGLVWNQTGVAGQQASCAASTGYATCEDFTRNNGAAFRDAYWEIASMKVYQTV